MENGVKQGGVLSPIIFCVYFDELLKRLESSGMGCYIGHHFYGCVGYTDDVKLLCPSINGLQSMINICENFDDEFDVTFNTKKTLCICYGSDSNVTLRQVFLNGSGRVGSGLGWYVFYLMYHIALNNYCASITCTILCVLVANKYYLYFIKWTCPY